MYVSSAEWWQPPLLTPSLRPANRPQGWPLPRCLRHVNPSLQWQLLVTQTGASQILCWDLDPGLSVSGCLPDPWARDGDSGDRVWPSHVDHSEVARSSVGFRKGLCLHQLKGDVVSVSPNSLAPPWHPCLYLHWGDDVTSSQAVLWLRSLNSWGQLIHSSWSSLGSLSLLLIPFPHLGDRVGRQQQWIPENGRYVAILQLFLVLGQVPLCYAFVKSVLLLRRTHRGWGYTSPVACAVTCRSGFFTSTEASWGQRPGLLGMTVSGDDPCFVDCVFPSVCSTPFPSPGTSVGRKGTRGPSLKLAKALLQMSVHLSVATSSLHIRPLGGDLWFSVP